MKITSSTQKKTLIFKVRRKNETNSINTYHAAMYPNKKVEVGIDLLRKFSKYDMPEYPIYKYQDLNSLLKDYEIIKKKGK